METIEEHLKREDGQKKKKKEKWIHFTHIKQRKCKDGNDLGSRRKKKEWQAKGNLEKNSRSRETRDGMVELA